MTLRRTLAALGAVLALAVPRLALGVPAVDGNGSLPKKVTISQSHGGALQTAAYSTTNGNVLMVACVSGQVSGGARAPTISLSTTAQLTWTLRKTITHSSNNTVTSLYTAWSTSALSGQQTTANITDATGWISGSLIVQAFKDVSSTVGASGSVQWPFDPTFYATPGYSLAVTGAADARTIACEYDSFGTWNPDSQTQIDFQTVDAVSSRFAYGVGAGTRTFTVSVSNASLGAIVGLELPAYVAPPVVTSLSTVSGSTAGGTVTTITGTGFVAGATVTVGGVAATVGTVTSTTISITTPAHAAGAVDVVVTNPDAQTVTAAGAFTYVVTARTAVLTQ